MDELDPLIASLEAFIREQQTPSFIAEDEVIRYPFALNPKDLFSFNDGAFRPKIPVNEENVSSFTRQVDSDSVDKELDKLRRQVKDLEDEKEKWQRKGKKDVTNRSDDVERIKTDGFVPFVEVSENQRKLPKALQKQKVQYVIIERNHFHQYKDGAE